MLVFAYNVQCGWGLVVICDKHMKPLWRKKWEPLMYCWLFVLSFWYIYGLYYAWLVSLFRDYPVFFHHKILAHSDFITCFPSCECSLNNLHSPFNARINESLCWPLPFCFLTNILLYHSPNVAFTFFACLIFTYFPLLHYRYMYCLSDLSDYPHVRQ